MTSRWTALGESSQSETRPLLVGWELPSGARFATFGAVEFFLGGGAILLVLRFAGLRLADIGWTSDRLPSDLIVGLAVASAFAALQFMVIIPATGGAGRSDIVANAARPADRSQLDFFIGWPVVARSA